MSDIKVCKWLDLNCGPLASEATALPTEPQPLPDLLSLLLLLFWMSVVKDFVSLNGGAKQFIPFKSSRTTHSRIICSNTGKSSVTRFGEISRFWQNLLGLGNFLRVYLLWLDVESSWLLLANQSALFRSRWVTRYSEISWWNRHLIVWKNKTK